MNEILINAGISKKAAHMLTELSKASDCKGVIVSTPTHKKEVLVVYGGGSPYIREVSDKHLSLGGRVVFLDVGYFAQNFYPGFFRFSVDTIHPTKEQILCHGGFEFKHYKKGFLPNGKHESYAEDGHVVLVGRGVKTVAVSKDKDWEIGEFQRLTARFPDRKIIFRPKKNAPDLGLPCDKSSDIYEVLSGASLVVCKHSNVACDAVRVGVPFECDGGAAMWFKEMGIEYTLENRIDFLMRLSQFNIQPAYASFGWATIAHILKHVKPNVSQN